VSDDIRVPEREQCVDGPWCLLARPGWPDCWCLSTLWVQVQDAP
jgi:hypothetical protein